MKEPIAKFFRWCHSWMTPGMGMFCNAFIILAVGNIEPILKISNPNCWGELHPECTKALQSATHYAVFAGLILGMLAGGYIGDKFGRRKGSIFTCFIMFVGNIVVVSSFLPTDQETFIMYAVGLGIFGFGVGGEYPLAAASAAEKAEAERAEREDHRCKSEMVHEVADRGRKVVLPFTMQGMGNFINTLLIIVLLFAFHQTVPEHYSPKKMSYIWRLQYGLGLLPLSFLMFYRVKYLKESDAWAKMKGQATSENRKLFFKFYWHRLVGTAGGWMLWDIVFYGNKIFQTSFIKMFAGYDADIIHILYYTLINAGIAWLGYFAAAFTIDRKWMGRRRMQLMGFTVLFVCFLICALFYEFLTSAHGLSYLEALYYATTFWGQWGPNATTWMFTAEVFPTHVRGLGNGISGACGPGLGALLGSLLFSYLDAKYCFIVCCGCGLLGVLLTVVFLPEVTRMHLDENDQFWHTLSRHAHGYDDEYHGAYKDNLSFFEERFWWKFTFHSAPHEPVTPRYMSRNPSYTNVSERSLTCVKTPVTEQTPLLHAGLVAGNTSENPLGSAV